MLVAHVLVPPAIVAILVSPGNRVQGFLAPGHVCAIMGWTEYEPIARDYRVPIVVTGFEPLDLLEGIRMVVPSSRRAGTRSRTSTCAPSCARATARAATSSRGLRACDRAWRGIGVIPKSGLRLRAAYRSPRCRGPVPRVGGVPASESEICIAGEVLIGRAKPHDCPAFGTLCTPERPLGAPMVSTEGACAAYFLAGRRREEVTA